MSTGQHCIILTLLALTLLGGGAGSRRGLQAQTGNIPPREGTETPVEIRGRVVDHESGSALAGAAVSLAAGPGGTAARGTRVTNSDGRFLFRDVPPGSYGLSVTLIGYSNLTDTLAVPEGSDLDLVLPLSVDPVRLEPVVVEAERLRPAMQDFERRRRTQIGTFITREEIEARNAINVTDLLRRVPGARITSSGLSGGTVLLRGGCRPEVWIDQVRVSGGGGLDRMLSPLDVEAIEVYHGMTVPVEFGSNSCGAIVIWTRVGEPAPDMEGFWRRAAMAAGLILLGLILSRGL